MKKNTSFYIFAIIIFYIFLSVQCSSIYGQEVKIAIIVHPDNPISDLSTGAIKLYYLRKIKKRWPTINKTIKPVDVEGDTKEKQVFLTQIIKMSHEDMENYFVERKISNAESPPIKLKSESEVIEYVSQNIGAIGFINKNNITTKVKVLYIMP